jgi:SnoaL-like domain
MTAAEEDPRGVYPLQDVAAVEAVLKRYSTAIDTKDWELFSSCFARDVDATYDDRRFAGCEVLTRYMDRLHQHLEASLHKLSNIDVRIKGKRAECRSYVEVIMIQPEGWSPRHLQVDGVYEDDLVKQRGRWVIQRRHFRPVWRTSGRLRGEDWPWQEPRLDGGPAGTRADAPRGRPPS